MTVIVWAESHSTLSILHSREKKKEPQANTATFDALGIPQAEYIRVALFLVLIIITES